MIPTAEQNFTDWQIAEANHRAEILNTYDQLTADDPTLACSRAAKILRVSEKKLRVLIAIRKSDQSFKALIPHVSTGRKPAVAKLAETCGQEILRTYLEEKARGHVLDTGTMSGTLRFLAKTDPDMPEPLRAEILNESKASKHNIAPSILRSVKVTRAERLAHRGGRALRLLGSSTPINIDVLPGDIWVPDDTTPIFGWWSPVEKCEKYPFGKKVQQGQLLKFSDYASGFDIIYGLIGREKGSYRATDIAAFLGDAFDDVGLPRLGFQLEGGTWQAQLIRGEEIDYSDDNDRLTRRIGALNSLPSKILPYHRKIAPPELLKPNLQTWRSWVPKSKPIEARFRMEQPFQGMLWGSLGRDQRRVPIEKTKKIFEACQRGKADPGLHFLSWVEMLAELAKIIEFLNWDRMEGPSRQGIPAEMWYRSIQENPLVSLPESQRWLYRRNWVSRVIAGAYVECSYKDEQSGLNRRLHYHNPELFSQIDGQRVLVYFDKEKPEAPAQIVALDTHSTVLGEADYWEGTGAFLAGNREGFKVQQRWESAVTRATRVMHKHSPSHQVPPGVHARREKAAEEKAALELTPLSAQAARGQRNPFEKFSGGEEAPVASPQRKSVRAMTLDEMIDADLPPPERETPVGANQPA